VYVDAQAARSHVNLVLVNDDDRLAARDVQAAPGAAKRDRYPGLRPVQDQAFVGRDPQLAGHAVIALPQHSAGLVQAQAGLAAWQCHTADVARRLGLSIQVLDTDG
jgi:hypothetical protein